MNVSNFHLISIALVVDQWFLARPSYKVWQFGINEDFTRPSTTNILAHAVHLFQTKLQNEPSMVDSGPDWSFPPIGRLVGEL